MCISRIPRLCGGLLLVLAVVSVAGTARAWAQDACKLSADVSRASSTPLPRVVCEETPSCARALDEWVTAFKRSEKAAQRLLEAQQQTLEAELKKPAVRDAVAKLLKARKDLSDALVALGKPEDALVLVLAAQIDAASRQPDAKSVPDLFATAAGRPGPDTLTPYETRAAALLQTVRGTATESMAPLAGLTQAAGTDLKPLKDDADAASTCLKTAEAKALKAGVDVRSTHPDVPGENTISIVWARFGEFGRGGNACDALPYVKRSCEYSEMTVLRNDGTPTTTTGDTTEKQWRRTLGGRSVCNLNATPRALCGGGDGPGLLGKQQVKITWRCGPSEQRYCRTWSAGEDVTMICDGDGSRTYAETARRRCP